MFLFYPFGGEGLFLSCLRKMLDEVKDWLAQRDAAGTKATS